MKKKMSKKNLIIATSILIGSVTIGTGVTYGVVKSNNYKEVLVQANQEIDQEMETIDGLFTKLKSFEASNGYLSKELTLEQLSSIKNTVNSLKDSHSDFHIEKDDLTSEINVIKVDKKSIVQKVKELDAKLVFQNEVNALFESPVIVGDQVTAQAIKSETASSTIDNLKETHKDILGVSSEWTKSLSGTLDEASSQLKQIETAKSEVSKLVKDGVVVPNVTRDGYNKAKSQVGKIKNNTIKSELTKQLDSVMKIVKENEAKAKAKAEAEAKAKAEAELKEKARQEELARSQSTVSSNSSNSASKSSNNSSSVTKKSSSSSSSKSNNNTSKSTSSSKSSNKSSSSSSSSGSSSKSSSGSTSKPSNGGSSNKSSGSNNSSSNPKPGSNVNAGKADSGGNIGDGSSTWESGVIDFN